MTRDVRFRSTYYYRNSPVSPTISIVTSHHPTALRRWTVMRSLQHPLSGKNSLSWPNSMIGDMMSSGYQKLENSGDADERAVGSRSLMFERLMQKTIDAANHKPARAKLTLKGW